MKDLLFLVHRIPFPPNKGDKIRSFHLFKHLSEFYRIHLGTFIDDPKDWQYVPEVKDRCVQSCFLPINPSRARLRSLKGLLTGKALSLPYYDYPKMKAWIDDVMQKKRIERILVFSSVMAQYVNPACPARKLIDFVDVDSDKWQQYANRKPWPSRWIYKREGRRLLEFDRNIAHVFDQSIFVSEHEAILFKQLAPEVSDDRVTHVDNGVDTDFFSAQHIIPDPYQEDDEVLVFIGAMDYWANVDAVNWFARRVFPRIIARRPKARFYIVGARPPDTVQNLVRQKGVVVTGTVDDIRPYLKHARLSVAPLRIARGIQNKVLEAMAMGKPILATKSAMEGINTRPNLDIMVADEPGQQTELAIAALRDEGSARYSEKNRECVLMNYSWQKNIQQFVHLLEASNELNS